MGVNELRIPNSCTYYQLIYTKNGYLLSFSNNLVSYYQNLGHFEINQVLKHLREETNLIRYVHMFHDTETVLSNSNNLSD